MIFSGAEFLAHQLRGNGGGAMGAVEAIGATADDAARAIPGAAAVVVGGALAGAGAMYVANQASRQSSPEEAAAFAATWKPLVVGGSALTGMAGIGAIAARGTVPHGGVIGAGLLAAATMSGVIGVAMSTDLGHYERRFDERAAWQARQQG